MSHDNGSPGLDPELAAWQADWKAPQKGETRWEEGAEARAEALRRKVRRRSAGLRWMTAGESLLTLVAVVILVRLARLGTPVDVFTLTAFALLALGAFAFSQWNRWGIWRPGSESIAGYLELSLLRCCRRERGLRAGWTLLVAEVALFVPWIWHRLGLLAVQPPPLRAVLGAYGFLAGAAGLMTAILLALRKRTRREREELEALRRSLEEG